MLKQALDLYRVLRKQPRPWRLESSFSSPRLALSPRDFQTSFSVRPPLLTSFEQPLCPSILILVVLSSTATSVVSSALCLFVTIVL